jgi:hypothetical protein
MEQLILHLTGDYLLQSDWMALNKIKNSRAAATHALVYSIPFLLLQPSLEAWFVIFFTHFLIDRFGLAKYVAYAKTKIAPSKLWPKWKDCCCNGYHKDVPVWLSTWLLIISDNTLHLIINYLALKYL